MQFRKFFGLFALAAGLTFGGAAKAVDVTFNAVGNTYTAQYVYTLDGANINASVQYTLSSIFAGSATFAILITNSTTLLQPGQNVLTAFGVDIVAPTLSGVSNTGAWSSAINTTLPGFQKVDLCAGVNGCSGGAIGGGVGEGGSLAFNVTVTTAGNFTTNGIKFSSPFPAKFQGVGLYGKSYEVDICPPNTTGCRPPQEIPEPGTLALLGLSIFGLAFARRRARS